MASEITFVDRNKFLESVENYQREHSTVKWMDLDQKICFKILRIQEKNSKFQNKCYLTEVMTRGGQRSKIFAPSAMIHRIKEERKPGQSVYFMPAGQKIQGSKTHNMFWLYMENEMDAPELLIDEEQN